MGSADFPLSLTIKAIDKATGPLAKINAAIEHSTAPLHNSLKAFKAQFKEGTPLGELGAKFKETGKAIGEVGHAAKETVLHFLEMEAVGGFALYELVKGAAEAGATLAVTAKRVGLNVDTFAQLQFAAGQAHVSQDEFNASMDQFNKRLGEAKAGRGPLLKFLQAVSPALAHQVKGAKSTEEAFGLMIRAFERVTDPAKRAALSAAAFGKGSLQFGQFLGMGSKAIDQFKKRFEELAGPQEAFAEGGEDLEKSMKENEVAFLGLRNAAAGALFPALTDLSKAVTTLIAGNREGIKKWAQGAATTINNWVAGGGLDRLTKSIGDMSRSLMNAVTALGGFKSVAIGAGLIVAGPLLSAVVGLGGALLQLGAVSTVFALKGLGTLAGGISTLNSGLSAAGVSFGALSVAALPFLAAAGGIAAAGYQIYKNWEPLKEFFTGFFTGNAWDNFKLLGSWAGTGLTPFSDLKEKAEHQTNVDAMNSRMASRAAPPNAGTKNETRVMVEFGNMPKGTRVTQGSTGWQADLNLGYSSVTP